jgi:hypothetical protein
MLYSVLSVKVVKDARRTKELADEFCRAAQGKLRARGSFCRRHHPQRERTRESGTGETRTQRVDEPPHASPRTSKQTKSQS